MAGRSVVNTGSDRSVVNTGSDRSVVNTGSNPRSNLSSLLNVSFACFSGRHKSMIRQTCSCFLSPMRVFLCLLTVFDLDRP